MNGVLGDPDFPALMAEYAAESAIDGMPSPLVKMERYQDFEDAGMLQFFAAFDATKLVGFISVLSAPMLHYSRSVAVSESFFVTPAHRGRTGLKLLSAAEAHAAEIGSPGLLVSAPHGSRLATLLPKRGFTQTNDVFFKKAAVHA